MPIINRTVYDADQLTTFNQHHRPALRRLWIVLYSIAAGIFLTYLAMVIVMPLMGIPMEVDPVYLVVVVVFLVLSVFAVLRLTVLVRYFIQKTNPLDTVTVITFSEDGLSEVETSEKLGTRRESTIPYSAIVRVTESPMAYYLYTDAIAAHIVAKDGFIEGTEADFKMLLYAKIEPQKIHIR